MEIDILDEQARIPVTAELRALLRLIFQVFWQMEARPGTPEVSIVLGDNDLLQGLNRSYRGLDEPTDVLSFPQEEPNSQQTGTPPFAIDDRVVLGDVVISLERAQAQAQVFGHSLEREIGYLFIHGLLHLAGMDHKSDRERRSMRAKEERILAAVDLGR